MVAGSVFPARALQAGLLCSGAAERAVGGGWVEEVCLSASEAEISAAIGHNWAVCVCARVCVCV